MTMGGTSG